MKSRLREKWANFLTVFLDPWVLLLLFASIALSYTLLSQPDRSVQAFLTVILAIASGVLGGIVTKRWEDLTGEALLVARGKTAIRSLKLLLGSTAALERRTRLYFDRYRKSRKLRSGGDLVSTYLEDVIERCTIVEEEVLSSIENWTDIIPEADVKSQIGLISDLKVRDEALNKEIKALSTELAQSRGKSDRQIQTLKAEKLQKERELEALRRDLYQKTVNFGPPLSTGSYQVGTTLPYQVGSSGFIPSPSSLVVPDMRSFAMPSHVTVIDPATGTAHAEPAAAVPKSTKAGT